MNFIKKQFNKFYLITLIALCLVLSIFYLSAESLISEIYFLQPSMRIKFLSFYTLFSVVVILLFLISYVHLYRLIYLPLEKVKNKIISYRGVDKSTELDVLEGLPDFWEDIESELILTLDFFKKKNRQTDRIKKSIENILNVFPEPTIVVNKNGDIKYYNKSFGSVFNLNLKEEAHVSDVFREPLVFSFLQETDGASIAKRKELELYVPSYQAKKVFIVFKTPYATKGEDGEYDFLMILHDITQMKKLDQMKTDFVSNVSHELRTPLMSIQGYLKTVQEDIQIADYQNVPKYLEILHSHVERLSNLISDLLELSYLESDYSLNLKQVSSQEMTLKVLDLFSLDLKKGNYKVNFNSSSNIIFHGEDRLLEQVLINLFQNALRYTPAGSEIFISWSESQTEVQFSFKDNGPGIAPEHLDRIFERFYRIDPHRSRTRGGTGLGLSIVKHIVQKHGGIVDLKSQAGSGVEFICKFPKKS